MENLFGKKEGELVGKGGHLYSAEGRRVIATTAFRNGDDALVSDEGIHGRMRRWD